MKVTVCELPDDRKAFESAWKALIVHVREQQSELVLLPELAFSSWFARSPLFDEQLWRKAQQEQDLMMHSLTPLAPANVLGTYLITEGEQHVNRAFIWTQEEGYQGVHDKYYFPNEDYFYERVWFSRQRDDFTPVSVRNLSLGFLICTEVMFNERARHYGRQGASLIAVPRASLEHQRWEIALRMAALVSGAFVISSNRVDEHIFGGRGMVVGPDGDLLAATSRQTPFITLAIDLAASAQAQCTYPRDVLE